MNGGGPGSGMWKSIDGGDTWTRINGGGFPAGSLGRISVDVFRGNANTIYSAVEGPATGGRGAAPTDESAPEGAAGGGGGRGGAAQTGSTGVYRSDDGGVTWRKTSGTNPRPMYFSQMRIDPINADRIYMGGVGLHMSIDGGKTFETDAALVTHDDIHAIWIDPKNSDHILIGNDGGLAVSHDMSRTWTFIPNLPVGLFYHVSFDMETPFNVCGGMQDNYDWCGPSASRMNRGIFNYDWFQIQGGDGFVAVPDLRDSRIIYTESQDGNMTRKNKITGESKSIRPTTQNVTNAKAGESYRFHWDTPLMLSPNNPGILLAAANRVFRSTDRGDSWVAISPDLTKNENRNDIVTMGLKGSDITISRNDGISQWPAIVALAESPKLAGVYYAGTDDGTVQMTRDDGKTWVNITKNLPGFPAGHAFVSEVVPSRFDAATVYVTVDNHRLNDYAPYVWMSTDFGATFRAMVSGLDGEVIKTLTEDTRNRDVLYVGTETGIFLSLDRGASWRRLKANFPTVRVDELTIHPRDNALLVATHGRALWILDHLEPIQEYAAAQKAEATLFTPGPSLQWKSKDDRNDEFWGHQFFTGENPPIETVLQLYFTKSLTKPALRISDARGVTIRELAIPDAKNVAGIQNVCWDQRVEPLREVAGAAPAGGRGGGGGGGAGGPGRGGAGVRPIADVPMPLPPVGYMAENPCATPGGGGGGGGFGGRGGGGGTQGPHVQPGTYSVALVSDGKVVQTKPLKIVMDPQVQMSTVARAQYNAVLMDLHGLQRQGVDMTAQLTALYSEMQKTVPKVDSSSASAAVKAQFSAFRKEFDAVRAKFGVGIPAVTFAPPGGGGGGGRGGAGADNANVVGRVGTVKGAIMGTWETPSASLMKQANEVKVALPAALLQANAVITKARAMSKVLAPAGVTFTVPPAK
jgi:CheY-like chemotaxis protein